MCSRHFYVGGPNHIESSTFICKANQWTGFYMIRTCVIKNLILFETFQGDVKKVPPRGQVIKI